MIKKFVLIIFSVFLAALAFSQKYQIEQDSGTFKPTKVVFESADGKPVDIYLLQSESQTVALSFGLNHEKWLNIGGLSTSVAKSYLMTIPGALTVDESYLNLYIGSARQFATFSIKPEGGTQKWKIHRYHPARYYGGLAVLCAGLVSLLAGQQVWQSNGSPTAFTTTLLAAGGAISAGGGLMIYTARPWARLVETDFKE